MGLLHSLNRWLPKFFGAVIVFFGLKLHSYALKHILEGSFWYGNHICPVTICYAEPHIGKNALIEEWWYLRFLIDFLLDFLVLYQFKIKFAGIFYSILHQNQWIFENKFSLNEPIFPFKGCSSPQLATYDMCSNLSPNRHLYQYLNIHGLLRAK